MKKILSLFAAVLFAFAANAAVINITNETPDALRTALNSAADGDEIVMAAGTYVESNSNYIAFDGKAVTVKAAEGAEVIIQPKVPITVSNGGHAIFENVKIDASRLTELADWYEHLLYVTDGTPNGCTFRGCELYGFNLNKSMFYCNTDNKVAAMKFENCYFHDLMKSIVFIENAEGKPMVSVKNCTFENISTNTESYYAGIIDIRATEATLQVDHCTFYNVIPMNTDYSCVSKITLAKGTVSNCIFMLPTAQDGIRAMRGVTASNCITFNYLKDSGTGIHSSVTQTNCIQQDPKFVNAAEGNFTLGEGSPALTLNDGEPIGDPRWVPAPVEPKMKTIYCKMTQDWWTKDGAAVACYTWNDNGNPKAAWPGERMTPVEGETDVWSIELDVNTYHMCIFTRVNGTGDIADWGAKTKDQTIPTDDKDLFTIAAAEVWGDPGCEGEWSKFEASAPVEKKVIYDWAGEVGTTILGATGVEVSTVKIHTNTDEIPAIKFGSSYVYADGKWIAIKPAEGGFKAGDVLSVAAVFNNADDTKYAQIDLRAANGDTRIWLSDSASTINGRTKAGDPIVQTYTLEADQDSLFLGRYGNTGMFVTMLKVERAGGVTPQPVNPIDHTYFATGDGWDADNESSAVWDPETGKITVTLALAKVAAWQGQVFINAVKAEPGKFYDFSVKMKANKNVNGATIKWQENNNDPIMVSEINTISLVADQEFVYSKEQIAGVDGNGQLVFDFGYAEAGTIIEIYDLVIGEAESAEHTYTVAGSSDVAFGITWDPANTANDMIKLEDGTYKWEKTGLTLAAGDVKFKVCQDHDWAVAYPAQDYVLNIPAAGIYTITITYNPEGNVVAADAVKTGEAVVIPTVAMHGNFTGEWKDTENFTLAEGNATASLKLTIAAGNYEFGMRIGGSGNWTANGAAFSRESNSAVIESGQGNLKLAADVDGEYTFTWTYETNTLSIAFPTSTGISNTNADVKAVKLIENGQIVIIRNGEKFNVQGQVIR